MAFLRAAGRAGPLLCLGLFPSDQQALWVPQASLLRACGLALPLPVPGPSSVKGSHPPHARPASALSRFSGACAQRAEHRARGEGEGSLSPSPAEPGSGLLGACWLCAHHSTSTRGLSSPVNPRCSCTSTLLPSWDAPGQHGCPICAPRAPAALLQLPHPPGGACVGLCPSEPVLKPEPLKVRGSSVIIHLWPPHSSQPGPCATAHSEKRCFSSRRRWP